LVAHFNWTKTTRFSRKAALKVNGMAGARSLKVGYKERENIHCLGLCISFLPPAASAKRAGAVTSTLGNYGSATAEGGDVLGEFM
jgi:hypothetical protein